MPKEPPSRFAGLGRPVHSTSTLPDSALVAAPTRSAPVAPSRWRTDRRSVPVYLTVTSWKQLRQLSLDTERSMSTLLIDGLDRLFQAHGLKSTGELEK